MSSTSIFSVSKFVFTVVKSGTFFPTPSGWLGQSRLFRSLALRLRLRSSRSPWRSANGEPQSAWCIPWIHCGRPERWQGRLPIWTNHGTTWGLQGRTCWMNKYIFFGLAPKCPKGPPKSSLNQDIYLPKPRYLAPRRSRWWAGLCPKHLPPVFQHVPHYPASRTRLLYQGIGFTIHATGGFVHQNDGRAPGDAAGNAQSAALRAVSMGYIPPNGHF